MYNINAIKEQAKSLYDESNKNCPKCGKSISFEDVTILVDNGASSSDPLQCAGIIEICRECRKRFPEYPWSDVENKPLNERRL